MTNLRSEIALLFPLKDWQVDKLTEYIESKLKESKQGHEHLRQLMIDADSLLTLFAFSEHVFIDKKQENKKEAERIAIGLRRIYENDF